MKTLLKNEELESDVALAQGPILVDFHADWCPPCRMMDPVMEELKTELEGRVRVVKINVDEAPHLAKRYEVTSIPNFVILVKGEVKERFVGKQRKEVLREAVERHAG